MAKDTYFSALDLGTANIRAAIGRLDENGCLEILGYGTARSAGIIKGLVENSALASEAIRKAIEAAEAHAKNAGEFTIGKVTMGVSGSMLSFEPISEVVAIGGEVAEKDLDQLEKKLEDVASPAGKPPIHLFVNEYFADRVKCAAPLGTACERLQASAYRVHCDENLMNRNIAVVNEAGSETMTCASLVADGFAYLTPEQRREGAILVNAGAGCTNAGVWLDGQLRYAVSFPVGGDHVSNDLSLMLDLTFEDGEALKHSFETGAESQRVGGKTVKGIDVEKIIAARIRETVHYVGRELKKSGLQCSVRKGVVAVGGAAQGRFFSELRNEFATLEVVPGQVQILPESPADQDKGRELPIYSATLCNLLQSDSGSGTVLGLLKFAALEELKIRNKKSRGFLGVLFN